MMTDNLSDDSENHDPSTPVPSLCHPSYPSSLISSSPSEEDISLYALALIRDPSFRHLSRFSSLISLASSEVDRPLYAPGPTIVRGIKNNTKLLDTDIIIAYGLSQIHLNAPNEGYRFMGPTGSGKSHVRDIPQAYIVLSISPALKIIDTLVNQPGKRSGSRLESCTTDVHAIRLFNHPVHGDRLVFVDTPGFDNTITSDLEILQMIANWLQKV